MWNTFIYRISANRSHDLTSNIIELMLSVHRTVVRRVLHDIGLLRYVRAYQYVIMTPERSKKQKSYALKLKPKAGESGGSNRSRGSGSIVLIQAGGFYAVSQNVRTSSNFHKF